MRVASATALIPAALVVFNLTHAARWDTSLPRATAVAPDTLPGRWELRPIGVRGMVAPGTGGTFEKFDRFAWMPAAGMLAFWAQVRDGDGKWGLYSWKDGVLRNVLVERREFQGPDGRGARILHDALGPSRSHYLIPGARVLYLRTGERIFSWDGERFGRVVTEGDTLIISGVPHMVRGAAGPGHADFTYKPETDGSLLVKIRTSQPREAWVWALHDGTKLMPLVVENDPVPGVPSGTWRRVALAQAFGDSIVALAFYEPSRQGGVFRYAGDTLSQVSDTHHRDAAGREYVFSWFSEESGMWSCRSGDLVFQAHAPGDKYLEHDYVILGSQGGRWTVIGTESDSVAAKERAGSDLGDVAACPAGRSGVLFSVVRWEETGRWIEGARVRGVRHELLYHDGANLTKLTYPHPDTVFGPLEVAERQRAVRILSPFSYSASELAARRGNLAPAEVVGQNSGAYWIGADRERDDWTASVRLDIRPLPSELNAVLVTRAARPDQVYMVDFSGPTPVLRLSPVALTDSSAVSIAGAIGWTSSGSAVLALNSGFYELRRK